ncbi:metallophosphoesterase family protein [Amphibacillus sediminis]|uniref:metallophosphoesterase family protein n=1 Tax=Amphibacillus sediminis TaxID=360185 RepID=UPI00083461F5|nr:exonuclease SbcCD subunit D [Amphibacillus sediminis]
MGTNVKFIHCADLHLDSPFKGMSTLPDQLYQQLKKSTFTALNNLVDTAIAEQVDFILIVGDIFDSSIQSVYAEMQFLLACQRLKQANITVYISFGNHDFRQAHHRLANYPDNVHFFTSSQVQHKLFTRDAKPLVAIHGFSYTERAVFENKTPAYKKVEGVPFQVGMLHGSIAQSKDHDPYAPFQLSELKAKGFDYWALGHIHKRSILSEQPFIVYSGNTQGRSIKEQGEKGCYVVELNQHQADIRFIPLDRIEFRELTVNVSTCEHIDQLYQQLMTQLTHYQAKSTILFISLKKYNATLERGYYKGEIEDIVDMLNERFSSQKPWIWIQAITLSERASVIDQAQLNHDPFMAELIQSFEHADLDEVAAELWHHPQARRFLLELHDDEIAQINKQALDLALYQLVGKV